MSRISNAVRSAVLTRLADPNTGFNAVFLQIASTNPYNVDSPYQIDFTANSTSFWQSYVTAEDLDSSSPDEGTLVMLYTLRSVTPGGGYQKFTVFSGDIQIGLDFDLSWADSAVPTDTESLADATEDALVQVFNASSNYGAFASNGIAWNGQFEMNRSGLRQSGESWRQRLACRLGFELHTN